MTEQPVSPAAEVFLAFLKLGLMSFGGPIAHLGYFRAEFVERRTWLSERTYADIVALSQFLPGPASSQTGFAIGLLRGGLTGALAAWAGFTLPSALLMLLFAYGAPSLTGSRWGDGALHGLKLVAVAIVAQAVVGMARKLAPDVRRTFIAVAALVLVLLAPGTAGQMGAIGFGAVAGLLFCHVDANSHMDIFAIPVSRRLGLICLAAFLVLLALAFVPKGANAVALFAAFYRSGALVFGGGHVVLPLLHDAVVARGWVSDSAFLTGYGAAQALPGPLFTFAAYLGAVAHIAPGGVIGGVVALVAIFLPGLLALTGTLPFWQGLRTQPQAQAAMHGVNAAVVGLLGAALYTPVWTSAVHAPVDFLIVVVGFGMLAVLHTSPLIVVALLTIAGLALKLAS